MLDVVLLVDARNLNGPSSSVSGGPVVGGSAALGAGAALEGSNRCVLLDDKGSMSGAGAHASDCVSLEEAQAVGQYGSRGGVPTQVGGLQKVVQDAGARVVHAIIPIGAGDVDGARMGSEARTAAPHFQRQAHHWLSLWQQAPAATSCP